MKPPRSPGKASFIAVVSAVVLGAAFVLVLVKFFTDKSGESASRDAAAAASVRASAASQAADEKALEASRAKYRRQLRFCEGLRVFEGANLGCLADFAAEHKDMFFCAELPAAARETCSQRVARATGDSRLCASITQPDLQRRCYLEAAAQSGDASACGPIPDAQVRNACLAVAASDPGRCDAVTETAARHACFRLVAVRKRDPSICDAVRNKQMSDSFQTELYECWKDAAIATGRADECDRIPHEGIRVNTFGFHTYQQCRERVAQRKAGAECREGPVDLTCRGKMAAAKGDFTMCEKLGNYATMDLCAYTFAYRTKQASACASIREERLKTACTEIAAASLAGGS